MSRQPRKSPTITSTINAQTKPHVLSAAAWAVVRLLFRPIVQPIFQTFLVYHHSNERHLENIGTVFIWSLFFFFYVSCCCTIFWNRGRSFNFFFFFWRDTFAVSWHFEEWMHSFRSSADTYRCNVIRAQAFVYFFTRYLVWWQYEMQLLIGTMF